MKQTLCFILFCSTLIMISGCSENSDTSLASILIYKQQVFIGHEDVPASEYSNLKKVGVISQQFSGEQIPDQASTDGLIANELTVGTEIYQLSNITLLAKTNDNQFKLFQLSK